MLKQKEKLTLISLKEEILKINEKVKDLHYHVIEVNHLSSGLYSELSHIVTEDGISIENGQYVSIFRSLILSLDGVKITLYFNDKHDNYAVEYRITKI